MTTYFTDAAPRPAFEVEPDVVMPLLEAPTARVTLCCYFTPRPQGMVVSATGRVRLHEDRLVLEVPLVEQEVTEGAPTQHVLERFRLMLGHLVAEPGRLVARCRRALAAAATN